MESHIKNIEKEDLKPIVVNKIRILERSSIMGLMDYSRTYGVSYAEAIRMVLHQFFDPIEEYDPSVYVQKNRVYKSMEELLNKLDEIHVSNRLVIKTLYCLSPEEYKSLIVDQIAKKLKQVK